MTDDIVTRLRRVPYCPSCWGDGHHIIFGGKKFQCDDCNGTGKMSCVETEAADEIERLRTELHNSGNKLVATQREVSELNIVVHGLLTCTDADLVDGLMNWNGDFRHAWKVLNLG